jgi:hypothetical protein
MSLQFLSYFVLLSCSLLAMIMSLIVLTQVFFNIPPYFPSFNRQIKRVLSEVHAELQAKHPGKRLRFVDLGSGDGRIVFMASQLGFESHGVEINPILWCWCVAQSFFYPSRPKFHLGSYFNHKLADYDLVFTYLFPETMRALEEKIFSELPIGSVVVTNQFKFKRPPTKSFTQQLHLYAKLPKSAV